jgi:hypothetical protein
LGTVALFFQLLLLGGFQGLAGLTNWPGKAFAVAVSAVLASALVSVVDLALWLIGDLAEAGSGCANGTAAYEVWLLVDLSVKP